MAEQDAGSVGAGQGGEAAAAAGPPPEQAPQAQEAPQPQRAAATVAETGPCARLVKIEVPVARVAAEIDKNYGELRKTVILKGFRPGHAPRHILERRFGSQVLDTAKEALVKEGLEQAIEDHKLRAAIPPTVDLKTIEFDPTRALGFEVSLEVVPGFALEGYRGIEVERPAVRVTEEDVAAALQSFRYRNANVEAIEEGVVGENDVPVCHAIAVLDGQEAWRHDELVVSLAEETLAGLPIAGLRDAMLGMRPGETKAFQVKLPDTFRAEELRGKDVSLEVTLDQIRRIQLPEATDQWARSKGFDDLEDLQDELHDELRRSREDEADEAVHARIAARLLELASFEVPQGLVERLIAQASERQRMAMLSRGETPEDIEAQLAAAAAQAREAGERQCKLYFIYERIAEQEKIFVTEDEVKQRIQAIALNYRRRPADVEAELEREGRLAPLRVQMREEKVRDFLVQSARISQAGEEPPPAAQAPQEQA